jgi:exonuclease VII small subunit
MFFQKTRTNLLLRRLVKANEDIASSLKAIVRHLDRNDTHLGAVIDDNFDGVEVIRTNDRTTWEAEQRDKRALEADWGEDTHGTP